MLLRLRPVDDHIVNRLAGALRVRPATARCLAVRGVQDPREAQGFIDPRLAALRPPLGLAGMPRRIPDYAQQFADWNMVATIGAFGFGLSQLIFVYALIKCLRGDGAKAPAKPWDGADTLEWTLPSPAPYHSFETPPVVK